jgi:hypothetical protein
MSEGILEEPWNNIGGVLKPTQTRTWGTTVDDKDEWSANATDGSGGVSGF